MVDEKAKAVIAETLDRSARVTGRHGPDDENTNGILLDPEYGGTIVIQQKTGGLRAELADSKFCRAGGIDKIVDMLDGERICDGIPKGPHVIQETVQDRVDIRQAVYMQVIAICEIDLQDIPRAQIDPVIDADAVGGSFEEPVSGRRLIRRLRAERTRDAQQETEQGECGFLHMVLMVEWEDVNL
jgi:hypothetical protein